MSWEFEKAVKRLHGQALAQKKAELKIDDVLVLCTLMSDLCEDAGEVTTTVSVKELSVATELSYDQVSRSLTRLRDGGMIVRKQAVKRAGETAWTTILPAAFSALGLPHPGTNAVAAPDTVSLPAELRELMCSQSWEVVDAVTRAWHAGESLAPSVLSEFRGGGLLIKRVERFVQQRQDEALAVIEQAIDEARTADELKANGRDIVKTADGPVEIDVVAFEKACPVPIQWQFVKDVLVEIRERDPRLVTRENLASRIAEAAYARIALPFAKNKSWEDGVRVLGFQMATCWNKPRRIWDSWYTAADLAVAPAYPQAQ